MGNIYLYANLSTAKTPIYLHKMSFHLGNRVEEVRKLKGMPKSELARRINKHRETIADILLRDSIDSDLILKLSEALQHNFFVDLANQPMMIDDFRPRGKEPPGDQDYLLNDLIPDYTLQPEGAASWKDKYYKLLERYNDCLEENRTLHKNTKTNK